MSIETNSPISSTLNISQESQKSKPTIPVVDMNHWFDANQRPFFIETFRQGLEKFGFVAVVNAPVNSAILDKSYDVAQRFFKQDVEIKNKIKSTTNSGERGYTNSESAKGSDLKVKDYKEFIHIGRELTPEQQRRLKYPENIWPSDFDLKEPMMNLYGDLEKMIPIFSEAIALALGERQNLITDMTQEGDHLLRAVHYPASPPEGEAWAAEHTDINLFTLLPRATAEGLQVKLPDNSWVDVVVPEKALIFNAGDSLQNLTNGRFRSAVHRVEAKVKGKDRYSIVMFAHARRDDRLDPLSSCIALAGGVRKYPHATRQELLEQRIVEMGRASLEMMERLHKSGLIEEQTKLGLNCKKAIEVLTKNGFKHVQNS